MSAKNHFIVWKGVRTGPFTKEELEREFTEGRIGLVRTIQTGGTMIPGSEFVADLEIKRREDELELQLQLQAQQMEASQKQAEEARQQAERQREEHRRQLEESAKRPSGKTKPPPVPDVNPWAPISPAVGSGTASGSLTPAPAAPSASWWGGKGPVILAAVICVICLLSGQIFRELTGVVGIVLGTALVIRKRIMPGAILMGCALLAYGLGWLLSELVHEYISKNYPN